MSVITDSDSSCEVVDLSSSICDMYIMFSQSLDTAIENGLSDAILSRDKRQAVIMKDHGWLVYEMRKI